MRVSKRVSPFMHACVHILLESDSESELGTSTYSLLESSCTPPLAASVFFLSFFDVRAVPPHSHDPRQSLVVPMQSVDDVESEDDLEPPAYVYAKPKS